jgi:hypothetical protein
MSITAALAALKACTQDDLAELDTKIANLQRELDSLRAARAAMSTSLFGKVGCRRWSDGKRMTLGEQLIELIDKEGPLPLEMMMEKTGRTAQAIRAAMGLASRFRLIRGKWEVISTAPSVLDGREEVVIECGPKSTEESDLSKRVFDLIGIEGSLPMPAIAARLGVPALAVRKCVVSSKWFAVKDGEVAIAKT